MKKHLVLLIAAVLCLEASAQVVVNEFSAANYSQWAQSGGWNPIYEDWLEFYNPSGSSVNISGYWLSDNINNPQKWEVPAGTNVPAYGYLTILMSGTGDYDPGYLGYLNTNFKVTQTNGDDVVFSNPGGTVLESYDFAVLGPNLANHSWGRVTDGAATWKIFSTPTNNAANGGPSFTGYQFEPQFGQQSGYYGSSINLTITCSDGAANIYYTTDGSFPTSGSTLYTGPISLNATTPIRAIAYSGDPNILPSAVNTNNYFFGADQHTIPWTAITGPTLSDGSWNGSERTNIEIFNADGTFLAESNGDSNEHGNDSNAYDQRGFDYITRDALGQDNVIQATIFSHTDRDEYERLIFKAAANDNYPFSGDGAHIRDAYVHELSLLGNLHLDERKTESCIVYINGDYWGVYEIREKIDDLDYTNYYYNQPEGFVDFIKTWGGTWEEFGSINDWNTLKNFILNNDMTVPANYDYVLTQYNTMSLIDYFILNGYCVTTDWLNWNTAWWRGRHPDGDAKRWRYALWDNDATFGHYINYTGVPDTSPQADPCNPETLGDTGGQGHVPILNKLFDNENFFNDYINRYASLSNTVFSCDEMIGILDSMIAVIEPEMQRHVDRWGGTYAGWEANVQALRDFINARCADEIIGGLEDCYDVTAYTLTVVIQGVGEVNISSVNLNQNDTPWSGIFWDEVPIDLTVPGSPCGTFAGWEIIAGDGVLSDPNNPNCSLDMNGDVTLQATFVAATGDVPVMVDVQPAGAGLVTVNGVVQMNYPDTYIFTLGELQDLSVAENEWFQFDHWDAMHNDINPNTSSTTVGFTSCVSDTIVAIFNEIPHFTLCVDVAPAGSGTITMNGTELTLPMCETFEGGLNYNFATVPTDIWSLFDHWELNHNTINPNEFSTNINFLLNASDTLVAVYTVMTHNTITVMVDPPNAGNIVFANNLNTDDSWTGELEGNVPTDFLAMPNPYWNFKGWTALHHLPTPNPLEKDVQYIFTQSDTIVAHFDMEAFGIWVPNSFSPNGDGVNDYFLPVGNAIDESQYIFKVFNRWGDVIFETTNPSIGWDGSHQSGAYYIPDGVYSYFMRVKSIHEAEYQEMFGHITLFR